jgi:nitrogen fixation/metabolism regulation signal transduction histidine kinase
VAAGNLSPKAALPGKDELGGLTRSFAMMTQQLADARAAVEQSMVKVDAARSNLQTILDNLTAGVIVLGGPKTPSFALPSV